MQIFLSIAWITTFIFALPALAQVDLNAARSQGQAASAYHKASEKKRPTDASATPKARLDEFRRDIQPVLKAACVQCHGPDKQKADFRVDTLNPDLLTGADVSWWLEVVDVLSNGDMPPAKKNIPFTDAQRGMVIDWLSEEIQTASEFRRANEGHSSFRRLTRYEYNYALQDLLGLPYNFADDLPPETASEEGFKNSSEMLQISTSQFELYRNIGRKALEKATVRGEKPPEAYYELIQMSARKTKKGVNEKGAYYLNRAAREPIVNASNNYRLSALKPSNKPLSVSTNDYALVLPGRYRTSWPLGINLPDRGDLHVRIRASRPESTGERVPTLRLFFGYQPSNNSKVTERAPTPDIDLDLPPGEAKTFEFRIPLSEVDRNPWRGKRIPKVNSSESLVIANINLDVHARAHIESVEVTTPGYAEWPPASHRRVFPEQGELDDAQYRRKAIGEFMQRAWRRPIEAKEIDRKVRLFDALRPTCEDDQEALIEVLSTVLASPHFLYLAPDESKDITIATRLAAFLWSSLPDAELLDLAKTGTLTDAETLAKQLDRMLAHPRAERLHKHFVRQWLNLELLDHLNVDKKVDPQFNDELREAMAGEPIALFREVLAQNHSIMDFLHADYTLMNEPLARHYGQNGVRGYAFRRVNFTEADKAARRGGLLGQAGLLAMNSDGKDSHPLKRGIWLLEAILNDPPPPPPPSVPEIDLADPEILKLTLKERMEDHRNDPACMSCHQRIDPWGIAFEHFDATGRWRDKIGKDPVDATSTLFNQQELAGIEGVKRYLLTDRQDQFARAMVHKLAMYALGRPLDFSDRAELEQITSTLRQEGDGLKTLLRLLVTSQLFQK